MWLHVDVDIVDPAEMPAVVFGAPGGPSLAAVTDLVTQLATVADVRGFELCGYDPTTDERGTLPSRIAQLFSVHERAAVTS